MSLPKFTIRTLDEAQRGKGHRGQDVLCDKWTDGTAAEAMRLAGIPKRFDAYHLAKAYWDRSDHPDEFVMGLDWLDVLRAICLMVPRSVGSGLCPPSGGVISRGLISRGLCVWAFSPSMLVESERKEFLEVLRKASGRSE